jgi:hypothetical protein
VRQVTITCAERGLLLLRVRDEMRMTTIAYQVMGWMTCGLRQDRQRASLHAGGCGVRDLLGAAAAAQLQQRRPCLLLPQGILRPAWRACVHVCMAASSFSNAGGCRCRL